MSVNLSIKNVPERLAKKLRGRARKHHRSIQGELLAILEASLGEGEALSPEELLVRVEAMGLKTKAESVRMIRADRDGRKHQDR
jgi:plasmid stability protein